MTNQTAILITIHLAVCVMCKIVDILYGAGVMSYRERTKTPKMITGMKMYKAYLIDFFSLIIPLVNIVRLFTLLVSVWGNLRYPEITDKNRREFYDKWNKTKRVQ